MAKGKYLCVKCGPPPKERSERGEEGGESRGHHRLQVDLSVENINHYDVDEVLGRHRYSLLQFRACAS